GSLERGAWPYVAAIVASSLLTAVYFFRVLEAAYFRAAPSPPAPAAAEGPAPPGSRGAELPPAMLLPILALAAGLIALGLLNQALVGAVIRPALGPAGL
ncbi:MAG TPA: NADH/ubiquinone/plastoquinone (complex I), partial [Vicinamibacteria bacterium]|nr:NADH/ubiquinone/plastoquinone (complex I) [Vicinamibacteria bacterium]